MKIKHIIAFILPIALVIACAPDGGYPEAPEAPEEAPAPVAEETSETQLEASSCPRTLSCSFGAIGYQNICSGGNGNDTKAFRCYNSNGTFYDLKPSKTCDDCRPYDAGTNWCNSQVIPVAITPWARCYPG